MATQDEKTLPESGTGERRKDPEGWATLPTGRVLRWFPQPGTKERMNPAGSTGVIRDRRPPLGRTRAG